MILPTTKGNIMYTYAEFCEANALDPRAIDSVDAYDAYRYAS